MSTLRTIRPRVVRLHLSTRYQCLHRQQSTATEASPPPPPPPANFLKHNRGPIAWSVLGLLLGLSSASLILHTLAPPALPDAGTREDRLLLQDLNQRLEDSFKVKVLRGKCLGVAKQLKGTQSGWVEIVPSMAEEEGAAAGNGLVGQMQGMKGMGVERLFWDRGERKLVAIVWFGPSLSGWPGVTHGGAIATALSDKMALAATLAEDKGGAVSAAAIPQRLPGTGSHAKMLAPTSRVDEPAQLSLSYVKPTLANDFYVIRVTPADEESEQLNQDPARIVPSEPRGGHEYEATLETMDAKICVKAKARFAPSGAIEKAEAKVKEVIGLSYKELREWLWPSRQTQSMT
ncbi:hypothetical protein Tdes44962_MAKER00109 [Teratosphaeria destructans]|uniref:Thioesterase domain-containing protein n=1 Tax=Teratosphaeria destructans TaxID=418781 RepID=A0A9W7W7A2_9PEZI|nr:hypothetical protein Tdes44962_MAKER00109 [Teratosphaeria destructans]